MKLSQLNRSALVRIAFAALAGGSVLTTCQSRFRDAVVFGTRDFFLSSVLDPATFVELLFPESETDLMLDDETTGFPE